MGGGRKPLASSAMNGLTSKQPIFVSEGLQGVTTKRAKSRGFAPLGIVTVTVSRCGHRFPAPRRCCSRRRWRWSRPLQIGVEFDPRIRVLGVVTAGEGEDQVAARRR